MTAAQALAHNPSLSDSTLKALRSAALERVGSLAVFPVEGLGLVEEHLGTGDVWVGHRLGRVWRGRFSREAVGHHASAGQ